MSLLLRLIVLIAALIAIPSHLFAGPITIDFESLSEFDAVTTQFAGLTFANATALTAGSGLNEIEFPPHSGANVVFDDSGPMLISFAAPIASFGGFFTYLAPLTLTAFDSSHNLLGSVSSGFLSNLSVSGNVGSSPNEFLQLAFASGIGFLNISGDLGGGSFVMDDLTFDGTSTPAPVPEPSTFSLMALGAAVLVRKVRAARKHTLTARG